MGAFLGAIGIVGVIAGIVLFILGRMKKKKYRGGLIVLVSFVLFIIGIVITPSPEEKAAKEKSEYESLSIEEKIEEALGEKTNTDKNRIVSYEDESNFAKLILAGDENLTTTMTVDSMLFDAAEVFPILFSDESVEKAMVTIQFTFVDQYGSESDEDAISIMLNRNTNDKITWDNFNIDNFPSVADSYYIHPGIELGK